MWINYQSMAVCPLILILLHKSSQKWLVFANYFGLPNFLPQLPKFFYTDISVISVTFSNSAYPRLYPILFYTHSWYICEKHSTVPWAKIKTELVLLTTINIENTQVQKKTEYTTQNSTLQQWWVHYGMAIMAVMAIMAIAEKVPVTAIEWMQWQYFLGWLDGTLISSKWNKLTNHTNVGGVVS